MNEYEKYEKDSKKIRTENKKLLKEFGNWLADSGLGKKTIKKHADNVDFYINEFLLYEEATPAKEGVDEIGYFLGYWFIKKAMWASKAHIKANAASLKKFYTFLAEKGDVKKEDLKELKQRIKEEMPEWLATLNRYDDPSITDMGEVWGI